MNNLGRFIVIEGLEGAGKTTALHTIEKFLAENNIKYITTREPGGTRVGEIVRTLIKEEVAEQPLTLKAELLLIYAARVQLLEQVIRPALQQGVWVISDRFEPSTYAYQGGGRKINFSILDQLSKFCVQDTHPDLLIFLDVPVALGLKRAKSRGELDRIEQESLEFFQDVYDAYHTYLKRCDNAKILDATQSLSNIQENLIDVLKSLY